MSKHLTLYAIYAYGDRVYRQAVIVEEREKTYKVVGNRCEATGYKKVIDKKDVGKSVARYGTAVLATSREEATRLFCEEMDRQITSRRQAIKRLETLRQKAVELREGEC